MTIFLSTCIHNSYKLNFHQFYSHAKKLFSGTIVDSRRPLNKCEQINVTTLFSEIEIAYKVVSAGASFMLNKPYVMFHKPEIATTTKCDFSLMSLEFG